LRAEIPHKNKMVPTWARVALGMDECTYHGVVRTGFALTATTAVVSEVTHPDPAQRFVTTQQATCCLCNKQVYGTRATVAARVLANGPRFGFALGTMCTACVPLDPAAFEGNPDCLMVVLNNLDKAVHSMPARDAIVTPHVVVERAARHVNATASDVFREFGRTQKVCSKCRRELPELKTCSRCRTIRYCSVECQTNDWARHKSGCKALRERPIFPDPVPRDLPLK
jgi:MYND finger